MRLGHRLIPLLAAVLVIQSLAAMAPHTHGAAASGTAAITANRLTRPVSVDTSQHCLACSVYVPMVEAGAEIRVAMAVGATTTIVVSRDSGIAPSPLAFASPRGPPVAV